MIRQLLTLGLALAAGWASAPRGLAQVTASDSGASGGITVYGSAQHNARPNLVEIDLRTSGTAELTDDALVKYHDAKKRTVEAFDALKLKNLKLLERGVSLGPGNMQEIMQQMWNGMPMAANKKSKIEISTTLHLRLTDIEKMSDDEVLKTIGKLLDTAQDSGTAFGPSTAELQNAYRYGRQPTGAIVKFVLRDLESLREKVYEEAVADARQRASRLAKLNRIKLGPVISVQEVQVSGDDAGQRVVQPYEVYQPGADPDSSKREPRIESSTLAEIPFRVKLLVRYSIDGSGEKTAAN